MPRSILITLLITLLAAPGGGQEVKPDNSAPPRFSLKDLNGRTVSLSDYKGKVVLLNFWATWCPPCRAEIPDLVRLGKEYQSRGLQILGMTYPEYSLRVVRRVARQLKVNYPVLLGSRELAAEYGVEEILPVTIVIDREGRVRGRILGIMDLEEFNQSVAPLLD